MSQRSAILRDIHDLKLDPHLPLARLVKGRLSAARARYVVEEKSEELIEVSTITPELVKEQEVVAPQEIHEEQPVTLKVEEPVATTAGLVWNEEPVEEFAFEGPPTNEDDDSLARKQKKEKKQKKQQRPTD